MSRRFLPVLTCVTDTTFREDTVRLGLLVLLEPETSSNVEVFDGILVYRGSLRLNYASVTSGTSLYDLTPTSFRDKTDCKIVPYKYVKCVVEEGI